MAQDAPSRASIAERANSTLEALRSSFGFPAGVAMVAGLVVGFALPSLDAALDVDLPVFDFSGQDAARSLLQTVATATVSVAGLSFSVTVVAFTLASSQLSPRVLRTFRSDRLTQATLAILLGTFIYCLAVLVRLGSADDGQPVPNLSVTFAIVLAFAAFATFAGFIAHIVRMLQPSSLVEGMLASGRTVVEQPYPSGAGEEPEDAAAAEREVAAQREATRGAAVLAEDDGYLSAVFAERIVSAAAAAEGLVEQRVPVGEYVTSGTVLAEVWCDGDDRRDELVETVREAFELGAQRTPVQDVGFPLRQLADVALKGLSPGINDPTTAENAVGAATALLVRFVEGEQPSRLRCDGEGRVRFVAQVPQLDDLVLLAFEQPRVFAAPYPAVARRLLVLLSRVDEAARKAGVRCTEAARQAALLAEGAQGNAPTEADVAGVRADHARLWLARDPSHARASPDHERE